MGISYPNFVEHPGYVAGRWYIPWGKSLGNVGTAPGADSIRLAPGYILRRVTISDLGVRVNTTSAGGNVSAAIYPADASTHLATGNALASTGDMATDSAAGVPAALGQSITLLPGLYWWATNCDNGTAVMGAWHASSNDTAATIGATSQGGVIGGSGSHLQGFSVSQTYGTWPDLTAASQVGITAASVPLVQFKAA